MAQPSAFRNIFCATVVVLIGFVPVLLRAEGVSLLADYEYFSSRENSTLKTTGIVTDSKFSRFSQLYQVDISRFVYPNLLFTLGGYYEDEDTDGTSSIGDLQAASATSQRTIRPYAEVDLVTPLYKAGLAYRTRDTASSTSFGNSESLMVEEYDATFNWRPVYLPLFDVNYQRIEQHDDPLTLALTRDLLSLKSKYDYKNLVFDYAFLSQQNFDNISDSGNQANTHNGAARFVRGFDYGNHHFDVVAGAKLIYNTTKFIGSADSDATIDTPAASAGTSFYIGNDSPPTSNEPFDLTLVSGANPLSTINIGRGGGLNPVSAGLSFGTPTEVEAVYITLSDNVERYPDLATPTQISGIANSYNWQLYSSDDQTELNWTQQPLSSVAYNSIDNRFEIRTAAPVSARRIKVTTTPLTLVAPGEIRYATISALITVSGSEGREPENLDQYYNIGLQWSPSARTTLGYDMYYRINESKPVQSETTSWTNSLFFRHALSPMFLTYGRFYGNYRTDTSEQRSEEETDLTYSLGVKAAYLETLSQSLVFTGTDSSGTEGSSTTNSVILRTDAQLYTDWSVNLDLGYSLNSLLGGAEQTVKTLRFGTSIEPNSRIDINLDYSASWTEETDQESSFTQFGTMQLLWTLTDTLNTFFRYNFRLEKGSVDTSTYLREFNLNWAPFPDGDVQFTIGYNESKDFGDQELRTIAPTLTWRVARGIFLDVRYSTGTLESPTESSDVDSYILKLRFFY